MAELKSTIDPAETGIRSSTVEIALRINGATHSVRIESRVSLLVCGAKFIGAQEFTESLEQVTSNATTLRAPARLSRPNSRTVTAASKSIKPDAIWSTLQP